MSDDGRKDEDKNRREAPAPWGSKESGQIEPTKSVEAPLPKEPAREDDD